MSMPEALRVPGPQPLVTTAVHACTAPAVISSGSGYTTQAVVDMQILCQQFVEHIAKCM
jgi:hypothetical protein